MSFKKLHVAFVLFMACLFAMPAFAQDRSVTGSVTDSAGRALPGVSVMVVGTTSGTQTKSDGTFFISVKPGIFHSPVFFGWIRKAGSCD